MTDQQIPVSVVDPDHPITRGLHDWTLLDEIYLMPGAAGEARKLKQDR